MEQPTCPPKTLSDLEWDRVLAALADRAESALGKQAARTLPFAADRDAALRALAEVREAVTLDEAADPLRSGDFPDASEPIARASKGAPLGIEELRAVHAVLAAAHSLRAFLKSREDRCPRLFDACSTSPDLDPLERTLDTSFEPDGTLSDRASPELASFRGERRNVRDRLVRKLEELVAKHGDLLQDGYFTERDGRYVLPVRADAHERFPGIVHSASQSGATVFVEPRAVVDQGNRLKMLDAQIDRAERAVLAALSAKVSEHADLLDQALRALTHADLRGAAAHLARDLRLTFPDIAEPHEPFAMHLRNARHPLLVLDGVDVVPSDIEAREGEAIIVSGPNAGGKTIALKTMGLAALLLRAGLPVPARDGSKLSVFECVLTDVGDDQNLHKNLSTFSAHVKNLAAILEETRPGALVLLDEVCGGTDPHEGEALAAAILDSLVARRGAVAATTHYEGLKTLALAEETAAAERAAQRADDGNDDDDGDEDNGNDDDDHNDNNDEDNGNDDNDNNDNDASPRSPRNPSFQGDSASPKPARTASGGRKPDAARPRFRNASVGFDLATMSPTFRLAIGVPGPSSALTVARRFGIPGLLIERAERFLQRDAVNFEVLVQKLVADRHDLDVAREAVHRETETLKKQREDLDAEIERLRAKDRAALTEQAQELQSAVRRAREELRLAMAKMKGAPTTDDLRVATRMIDAVAQKVALGGELSFAAEPEPPERSKIAASTIKIGARVYVPKLRAEASVIDVLANGQLRVAAGSLTLTTRVEDVRAPDEKAQGARGKGPSGKHETPSKQGKSARKSIDFDAAADPDVPLQTADNTVDLRGLRAHEAAAMADQFLDRMMGSGKRVAFLIHGHGTGALRDAIRDSMRGNPYVARSRAGEQREGGDGVTVVWLR